MTHPANALRTARLALGYPSQKALAAALNAAAREIGLRVDINERTVRRWESENPPMPQAEHKTALETLFQRPVSDLGFTISRAGVDHASSKVNGHQETWASRHSGPTVGTLPASVATDFMTSTSAYRRMYWTVPPARLERLVAEHAALGWDLHPQIPGAARSLMARAVAESSLLAGRLEFFDLQQPEQSRPSFLLALQAASAADEPLLGAAALAHMAFAPAFENAPDRITERADNAREKLRAARTFARRGEASEEMIAWLDAVEAEVETRFGNTRGALQLIAHAEESYGRYDPDENASPTWLDWFSPVRLAGFKGNTQLAAGQSAAARATLELALEGLPADAKKQRAVFLADIAAADVMDRLPEQACEHLKEALKLLGETWYATAMERVKGVRNSLREWDGLPQVRDLDDQLYDWNTTIKSLAF